MFCLGLAVLVAFGWPGHAMSIYIGLARMIKCQRILECIVKQKKT